MLGLKTKSQNGTESKLFDVNITYLIKFLNKIIPVKLKNC